MAAATKGEETDDYKTVRNNVIKELEENKDSYKDFIDKSIYQSIDEYIEKMREDATYGDHLTLNAAANVYNLKITVYGQVYTPKISPKDTTKPAMNIYLIYRGDGDNGHYNAAVPKNAVERLKDLLAIKS